MEHKLTALVCPLDWGLGHASRDILLIRELINAEFKVILAGDGPSLALLNNEFPGLQMVKISSARIAYSHTDSMVLKMLWQLPRLIGGILREHRILKKVLADTDADLVISDNRFGLWNKKAYSIYITHQLWIKFPKGWRIFERPVHLLHRLIISRYNQCWIPDTNHPVYNLGGKLSHIARLPSNSFYAGIFSRFISVLNNPEMTSSSDYKADVLVIVSGPEPQRTIFEELMINRLEKLPYKALIIRGLPGEQKRQYSSDHIRFKSHLSVEHFHLLLKTAKYVICRSGYSTLMDLVTLGRKAILVPTPGQPEQEYLAVYFSEKYNFITCQQNNPDLQKAIEECDNLNSESIKRIDTENKLREIVIRLQKEIIQLKNKKHSDHSN